MSGVRLIAGSGRSGTTWVQDALAAANGMRPVFEPLHPYVSAVGNRYAHRALAPDEDHPDLEHFLADVCAGRRNRFWTQYRRQRRWLLPPPEEFWTVDDAARLYRRWGKFLKELPRLSLSWRGGDPIVKCIRANLMLGWLSKKLNWNVLLIVRHPGAVIESELRGSWNAQFALDRFRRDAGIRRLTEDRYDDLLERKLTPIEALAARWVIENQWVTERAESNGVTVVYYELLRIYPDKEWERICQALDLAHAPPETVLTRPSQQSSPKITDAVSEATRRPRWLETLAREQIEQIQGVLDQAGVAFYSMSDPAPRLSVASNEVNSSSQIAHR